MSKNAEGWVRHRGGKCPVDKGTRVDVRFRNGDVVNGVLALEWRADAHQYGWSANTEFWIKHNVPADIMAFRPHKPAEQPYVRDERDIASDPDGILIVNPCDTLKAYKPSEQVEACSKPELQIKLPENYGEILERSENGPLQWRDRIAEIDVEVQARTVERAELVQKLASEGFALIGRINDLLTDAAQKHEDMSDWRNWKVGDLIVRISDKKVSGMPLNEVMKINRIDADDPDQPARVGYGLWPYLCDVKWHSRPSA